MVQRILGLRRRSVLAALTGIAVCPSPLLAQGSGRARVIGILIGQGRPAQGQWRVEAFDAGLRKLGWINGQTARIEYRWGEGDPSAVRKGAEELVAAGSEVLVSTNTLATNALRAVTSTTPIIFVNVTDPVGNGLVPSLTHPGGNLTGYTDTNPVIAGKWGELLKTLVPGLRTVVLVYAPDVAPWAKVYFEPFEAAAHQLSLTGRIQPVKAREDYEPVFNTCGRERGCGVILIDDALFARNLEHITALARDHKVPTMYTNQGYVITFGALIAYGLGITDLYIQSADYIDKILKGARPADLPVQMPTTYRMAVNLQAAAAIGLNIPLEILAQADRIVE